MSTVCFVSFIYTQAKREDLQDLQGLFATLHTYHYECFLVGYVI